MPKDKDLKRLIRTRMVKTGEAYTAARAHILAKRNPPVREYATLGGMSDEAVAAKTGRTWAQWVDVLDEIEAITFPHPEIAKWVEENHDVSDWWAQTVTVGYERIRGLREIGQQRHGSGAGSFQASKSKTFPVSVETLYPFFASEERRREWLNEGDYEIGDYEIGVCQENRSVRMRWSDGTRANAWFTAKGPDKCSVQVGLEGLPDKEAADEARTFWGSRLQALATLLSGV